MGEEGDAVEFDLNLRTGIIWTVRRGLRAHRVGFPQRDQLRRGQPGWIVAPQASSTPEPPLPLDRTSARGDAVLATPARQYALAEAKVVSIPARGETVVTYLAAPGARTCARIGPWRPVVRDDAGYGPRRVPAIVAAPCSKMNYATRLDSGSVPEHSTHQSDQHLRQRRREMGDRSRDCRQAHRRVRVVGRRLRDAAPSAQRRSVRLRPDGVGPADMRALFKSFPHWDGVLARWRRRVGDVRRRLGSTARSRRSTSTRPRAV